MNLQTFAAAAAAVPLLIAAGAAVAQSAYPQRPVRFIIPFAPGGAGDFVGRIVASKLTEVLGQTMVVDNRPGASGFLGVEIGAAAKPDGYTMLLGNNGAIVISPAVYTTSPVRPVRDLAPISQIVDVPSVLVVHPSMPVKTVRQLIDFCKKRPGKLNFASPGSASGNRLEMEVFRKYAGIDMTHVPYKGAGPALIGAMSGEIDLIISGVSSGLPYIKQRQLRALGVTSPKRLSVLPDIPAVAETVAGYEAGSWYAMMAPTGTPRAIVERLNRDSAKALNSPDVNAKLIAAGVDPEILSPEALGAKIRSETERWGKVVKAAGVKAQ